MLEYEYYNWNNLINDVSKQRLVTDIDAVIDRGDYWKNSPPFQTNINVFGISSEDWVNLKMSFIWSCFAYMKTERQIKSVKSWAYKTNLETQENRDLYWHQHLREGSIVLSGVYYLSIPEDSDVQTIGTELAYDSPEGETICCPAKPGNWLIFPGKTWHRPGELKTDKWRHIVAADMEI